MRRKRPGKLPHFLRVTVILLLFLLILFFTVKILFDGSWDGISRFTVVLQNIDGKNLPSDFSIAIFSVEPSEKTGNYLYITSDFMLDIPYGYKSYPVYSIYKLGELDRQRGGGKLITKSIESSLGIKTDRYILLNSKNTPKIPINREQFIQFKKNNFNYFFAMPFFRLMLTNNVLTDMTFMEKIRFFRAVKNLIPTDINFTDLSKSTAGILTELPDKSKVMIIDQSNFDHLFSSNFQDIKVRQEEFTIEVQNATGKEKIASQFSRILETLGAHVILKTTSDQISKASCKLIFFTVESKKSNIGHILKRDYQCQEIKSDLRQSQSDLKVIIGEGFLK